MWQSPWYSLETDSGLDFFFFFFKNGTKSNLGQAKGQSFLVSLTMAVADTEVERVKAKANQNHLALLSQAQVFLGSEGWC